MARVSEGQINNLFSESNEGTKKTIFLARVSEGQINNLFGKSKGGTNKQSFLARVRDGQINNLVGPNNSCKYLDGFSWYIRPPLEFLLILPKFYCHKNITPLPLHCAMFGGDNGGYFQKIVLGFRNFGYEF